MTSGASESSSLARLSARSSGVTRTGLDARLGGGGLAGGGERWLVSTRFCRSRGSFIIVRLELRRARAMAESPEAILKGELPQLHHSVLHTHLLVHLIALRR